MRALQYCALAVALAAAQNGAATKVATEPSAFDAAAEVAAKEVQRRGLHRAAVLVCWGSAAERRLTLTLSATGVAVSLLRGREQTAAAAVEGLLREGSGRTAVLVDMACPAAPRLLLLASKLRLFDLANFWFLLENGRLDPSRWDDPASLKSTGIPSGDGQDQGDFPDVEQVKTGRYSARRREDALLPDEEVLLEVWPPSRRASDRPWITSQVALVSPAALRLLDGLVVLSDSEVLWVQAARARARDTAANDSAVGGVGDAAACRRPLQAFIIFRTSLARDIQAYLAAAGCADAAGGAEWRWTLSAEEEKAIQGRRSDLQGATLRSPIIINFPELYTFIDDLRERKRDYRPKTNFPVVRIMAEQANVHMLVFQRWDYGYNRDADGMFDGLMGELQRFECDLLSTAVYVTDERLYVLDSVAETFPLRTGVIYRPTSSSHSAADLYLRPFSRGVWLATAAVALVCVAQLVASTRPWMTRVVLDWDECLTAVIGALSQQGTDRTPETVSGRTVMVFMLLMSFFLFTSFSAFIVALLQAPAEPLGSPRELLASSLKIGAMDVAFIHAWFRGEAEKPKRGVVGDIFVKKIKTHERPAFLPVWEGIELVRARGYGYQAELNEAYHEIQEKFTQSEKCDLFEMELFPSEAQIIVTVEKSPYREVFSRFVRWQRELGHLDRIAKRWYASRPRCESGARGLMAIGVREVVPLLLLLTYGIALSLLCLLVECLTARRQQRQQKTTPSLCQRLFGGRRRPQPKQPSQQRPRRHAGLRRGQGVWPWRPLELEVLEEGPARLLENHTLHWRARGRALGHFAWQARQLGGQQSPVPFD